jgi:hypothetical protein
MYTKLLSVIAIIEIMWGTIFQFCILIVVAIINLIVMIFSNHKK